MDTVATIAKEDSLVAEAKHYEQYNLGRPEKYDPESVKSAVEGQVKASLSDTLQQLPQNRGQMITVPTSSRVFDYPDRKVVEVSFNSPQTGGTVPREAQAEITRDLMQMFMYSGWGQPSVSFTMNTVQVDYTGAVQGGGGGDQGGETSQQEELAPEVEEYGGGDPNKDYWANTASRKRRLEKMSSYRVLAEKAENNPWAICHDSVEGEEKGESGGKAAKDKYERCVKKVKEKV